MIYLINFPYLPSINIFLIEHRQMQRRVSMISRRTVDEQLHDLLLGRSDSDQDLTQKRSEDVEATRQVEAVHPVQETVEFVAVFVGL